MFESKFDLLFTEDGELIFDEESRDFQKAFEEEYETLTQTILKRIQSSDEDWNLDGTVTANLNYLRGSAASNSIIDEAKSMIFNALTLDGYLDPEKVTIQSESFNNNILLFNISVLVNENDFYNVYNLGASYDMRDNRCIPRYIQGKSAKNG